MKSTIKSIAIVGASGATGKAVVNQALAKAYEVIAVVRYPEKVTSAPGLTVRKGDVMEH